MFCVVMGSLVLGLRLAMNMKNRVQALRELERIVSYLEGELKFRHSLLSEALENVSAKVGHPFNIWLESLSHGVNLQSNQEHRATYEEPRVKESEEPSCIGFKSFYHIWCESLETLQINTYLNPGDINMLLDVGKALGYLDIESQLMNLGLEKELIHRRILELDKDIGSRMKSVIVLCFLGGIMTVIALL